jgi:GNAT superfamily N-acetyltransferase
MMIRTLTAADIPFGLHLSRQNDWNQLEGDWQRQLALEPEGGFLAEVEGQPAGIACTCIFGDVAWVNMVLVEKDRRGQGIGTALIRHILYYLDARAVATVRLDATPLGQPIYAKLGFVADFTLDRYAGIVPAIDKQPREVEPLVASDLPEVLAMDEAVTKTQREKFVRRLFESAPRQARKFAPGGLMKGYVLGRPGANAWYVGPLQGSPGAALNLALDAARRFTGQPVYLDVPVDHPEALALAMSLGLKVQRSLLRMTRGRRILENLRMFWTSGGPEKG